MYKLLLIKIKRHIHDETILKWYILLLFYNSDAGEFILTDHKRLLNFKKTRLEGQVIIYVFV